MAYLALYRKYRPCTFSQVISQPHITVTLQNQLNSGQIAHAYLFTGSRGTGKTTCAKILAKAVNCIGSGAPCLTCDNCKAADESPDIQEIDAASNNGVEDIRALREEAGYLPSELKYKVYIIDEVHMLSTSAFNALLKTLEEPPPHVIFILATTEIHKIPATVLSRCQRYEFNRINSEESATALIDIADKEGITLEKDAALLIARLSDGGMRDALSLLDVAAAENKTITQCIVRDCAGIAGKEHLFAIADAIASGDGKTALTITSELYAKSKDPTRLIDELLQHFRNLMIVKLMKDDFSLLTVLKEEIPEFQRQAERFTIERIMDCLDKLEDCLRLKGRRVEAEICLMRLCVCKETQQLQQSATVQSAPPPAMPPPPTTPEPVPPPLPPTTPEPVPPPPPPPPPSEPMTMPPPSMPRQRACFAEWETILKKLDVFKAAMLEEATSSISDDAITVSGDETLGFFFDNPENVTAIKAAISETMGRDYNVEFRRDDSGANPAPSVSTQEEPSKIDRFLKDVEQSGLQLTIT